MVLLRAALGDMDDVPCSSADKLNPIQSAVTGRRLRISLRTALRTEMDVDVFEVFSCEATEDREAGTPWPVVFVT